MYLDQLTGVPHVVCWSKSFFGIKTYIFLVILCAILSFFPFVMEEDGKLVLVLENDFDQQRVCGSPIHRSKYATYKAFGDRPLNLTHSIKLLTELSSARSPS